MEQIDRKQWSRARLRLGCVLAALAGCVVQDGRASAQDLPLTAADAAVNGAAYPACRASVRLNAVQYDARRAERSFAIFGVGVDQRPRVVKRGTRIAGYELASIEQGAVVLSGDAGRCSLRLQGAAVQRDLRAIPVAEVRGKLRARRTVTSHVVQGLPSDSLARRD